MSDTNASADPADPAIIRDLNGEPIDAPVMLTMPSYADGVHYLAGYARVTEDLGKTGVAAFYLVMALRDQSMKFAAMQKEFKELLAVRSAQSCRVYLGHARSVFADAKKREAIGDALRGMNNKHPQMLASKIRAIMFGNPATGDVGYWSDVTALAAEYAKERDAATPREEAESAVKRVLKALNDHALHISAPEIDALLSAATMISDRQKAAAEAAEKTAREEAEAKAVAETARIDALVEARLAALGLDVTGQPTAPAAGKAKGKAA